MIDEEQPAQGNPAQQREPSLLGSIRQHSVRLGLFALGAALLLALVNTGTAQRIAEQERLAELEALNAVLPPTAHDNDLLADSFMLTPANPVFAHQELLGLSSARPAYRASLNGESTGVILPLETPEGYSGTIVLLIGINANGAITGVRALDHNETPGLGDKIDLRKSPWILTFDNRSQDNTDPVLWRVKKDGGEFGQFVGATITPRAVVAAVSKALTFFAENRAALLNPPVREPNP